MKFESGLEKQYRENKKANGEKLSEFEAYEDFNHETADELLEKRRKEEEELKRRHEERIKKLKEMEKDGILYVKE